MARRKRRAGSPRRTPAKRSNKRPRATRKRPVPPAVKRRPKKSVTPFAKQMQTRDRAIDELRGKVKPGAVKLATTRQLTPTKRGFRALRETIKTVRAAQTRGKAGPKAFTFKLRVRYRGPDGRFKKLEPLEGSFPLPRSIRSRKKKGESEAAAFTRLTETRIKAAVFRGIDRAEGVAQYPKSVERALASGDRDRITRAMQAFKKRRGVSFKVSVERQVTRGANAAPAKKRAAKKGTTKAVSRRAGQRGRRKR